MLHYGLNDLRVDFSDNIAVATPPCYWLTRAQVIKIEAAGEQMRRWTDRRQRSDHPSDTTVRCFSFSTCQEIRREFGDDHITNLAVRILL
jgi:hypothetical protein